MMRLHIKSSAAEYQKFTCSKQNLLGFVIIYTEWILFDDLAIFEYGINVKLFLGLKWFSWL